MRFFTLTWCLLFFLLVAGFCHASKGVALVIGNSSYSSAPLNNPLNDADDMAKLLRDFGFDVIKKTNVNKRQMLVSVSVFSKKPVSSEIGLFYYAGLGM